MQHKGGGKECIGIDRTCLKKRRWRQEKGNAIHAKGGEKSEGELSKVCSLSAQSLYIYTNSTTLLMNQLCVSDDAVVSNNSSNKAHELHLLN